MIRLGLLPEAMFALSLLATYLAHSTLWFLVAWAVTRPRLGLSSATRCWVWRAALVGPLAGTVLALAVADGWRVPAVELALSPARAPAPVVAPVPVDLDPEGPLAPISAWTAPPALPRMAPTPPPAPLPPPPAPVDLGLWLLVAMAAISACRLVVLGTRQLRFWRRLRGRRAVFSGPACERLRGLAARAALPFPIRLSLSPLARGPMALGRGEICLPPRALEELPGPALSAVLAHEIAHLERRDNGWLTAGAVIEAVLFIQPLTRLVRRELSAAAELACDERAVELTDSPVALARSIAIVAGWQLGRAEAVPVAAMARTPLDGDVVARVKRLLADRIGELDAAPVGRQRLVVAALVVCGLMAPAIGGPAPLQAASLVPMPLPKATQAANRFLEPPAPEVDREWDDDGWDRRRVDRPRRPRPPRAARPPRPPRPPHPAVPPMPPIPPMPHSVGRIAPLAAKMAALGMQLGELHASKAGETLTPADRQKEKQLEQQMAEVRAQLEVEEKRFAKDMEEWNKRFEQEWGKDYQKRMDAWGKEYGKRWQEWHQRHGRDLEHWAADWGRRMADVQRRQHESWQRHEERQRRMGEMHERQERRRRDAEEARRRATEERRRAEHERQGAQEERRRAEEERKLQRERERQPVKPPPPAPAPRIP